MKQLVFGATYPIGGNILVFSVNSPLTVPITKGYTIKIVPALEEKGVRVVGSKVKFPSTKGLLAIVVLDDVFKEAQVREWTKDVLAATAAGAHLDQTGIQTATSKFLEEIDSDSEIAKVFMAFFSGKTTLFFKVMWNSLNNDLKQVNWDKFQLELAELAKKHQDQIPSAPSDN